jgi:hypothetical protein
MYVVGMETDINAKTAEEKGPFPVVTGVKVTDDDGMDHVVTCENLNIFQLRKLIGIENSGSFRKFVCRQQIAALIQIGEVP